MNNQRKAADIVAQYEESPWPDTRELHRHYQNSNLPPVSEEQAIVAGAHMMVWGGDGESVYLGLGHQDSLRVYWKLGQVVWETPPYIALPLLRYSSAGLSARNIVRYAPLGERYLVSIAPLAQRMLDAGLGEHRYCLDTGKGVIWQGADGAGCYTYRDFYTGERSACCCCA